MNRDELILATLMWDCAQYSNKFSLSAFEEIYGDDDVLGNLPALTLDDKSPTASFLLKARQLAFGNKEVKFSLNDPAGALRSILTSINFRKTNDGGNRPESWYFPYQRLHEEPTLLKQDDLSSYEVIERLEKNRKILLNSFSEELLYLHRNNSSKKVTTILSLLEKYFWCVPPWGLAGTTDVPVFALAKMSAAILACWPATKNGSIQIPDDNEKSYALICGDISGIQKYIYRISSSKGAAKGLKARSFELAILSDVVNRYILDELHLSAVNSIYSSGGKFFILAPNSTMVRFEEDGAQSISDTILTKFWDSYKGELSIGIGAVAVSGNDFLEQRFGKKWQDVANKCNEAKNHKFRQLIRVESDSFFEPQGTGGEATTCDVCLNEEVDGRILQMEYAGTPEERMICNYCVKHEKAAKVLSGTNVMAEVVGKHSFSREDIIEIAPLELNISYYLMDKKLEITGDRITYLNVNFTDYENEGTLMWNLKENHVDCSYRFYGGNKIPHRIIEEGSSEKVKKSDYNDLADASQGKKRLGILRMDVDNLGRIFSSGLGSQSTASRVLTLSWHLNYYFSGRLNKLRTQVAENELIIVYSGGDDLFVVGSWNQVVDFALRVRQDFAAYAQNSQLTISGGMVIVPKKFPIHKSAIMSGEAEEAAKDADAEIRKDSGEKEPESAKNGFTFLDKPLRWHDFEIAASIKDALLAAFDTEHNDSPLDHGLLSRLRHIYSLYSKRQRELEKMKKNQITKGENPNISAYIDLLAYDKWRWRLVYSLNRYKKMNKKYEALIEALQCALIENKWQWVDGQLQAKTNDPMKPSEHVKIMDFIDVPVRWVELLLGKEKDDE